MNAENKRSPGRPKLANKEKATRSLVIMLTDEENAWLEDNAKDAGLPKATLVKQWIRQQRNNKHRENVL